MRFKNLDLNLLVALDTLIRVRNVSRAAEEMFITQSAMSNALGRLRDYFDDPLLIQVGRAMELSPLAVSLEQPLRDIIVRIDAAVVSKPSFVPEESTRSFNMVVSDYTLNTLMPEFMARVSRVAPGLEFHFTPQQNHPHLLLERGEADLLIAPSIFCSDNHPSAILLEDPLCCIVSEDFSGGDGSLTEEVFLTAGHVVMQPPAGGKSFAQQVCEERGVKINIEVTAYTFWSLPLLVRGTDRIAIIQTKLADQALKVGGLKKTSAPFLLPALEQSVQWHSYRTRDPALKWIREQMSMAAKHPS